jgi:hypothetical protein
VRDKNSVLGRVFRSVTKNRKVEKCLIVLVLFCCSVYLTISYITTVYDNFAMFFSTMQTYAGLTNQIKMLKRKPTKFIID